jgi:hypothetical protein
MNHDFYWKMCADVNGRFSDRDLVYLWRLYWRFCGVSEHDEQDDPPSRSLQIINYSKFSRVVKEILILLHIFHWSL